MVAAFLPTVALGGWRVVHALAASRRLARSGWALAVGAAAKVSVLRLASVGVAADLEVSSVVTKIQRVVSHPTLNSSGPPPAAA